RRLAAPASSAGAAAWTSRTPTVLSPTRSAPRGFPGRSRAGLPVRHSACADWSTVRWRSCASPVALQAMLQAPHAPGGGQAQDQEENADQGQRFGIAECGRADDLALLEQFDDRN